MALDHTWCSETYSDHGAALSLKITKKLHEEQSPFQKIEIFETSHCGNLMVLDGCFMVTDLDNFIYHEMMTHPVLFTHPKPKRVVIIGGGDCGTLREVLRHPGVEEAFQIEIDERVTRVAEKYFPDLTSSNHDPRARLLFIDGIKFIQEVAPGSLDVIIVDSTDPVGPAKGLFSRSFFESCRRALGEEGLIVQQSESPLFHLELLKEIHAEMRAAGFKTVQTLPFPQFIYPSGWWSCTMAGKANSMRPFRNQDAANKSFPTRYYSAEVHQAALVLPPFAARALNPNIG